MGNLLRLLEFDGPVVGVGVVLALIWLIVRLESTRSENAAAHDGITRNIEGLRQQSAKDIDGVKQQSAKDIDGLRQQFSNDIDGVKEDVRDVKQEVREVKQDVRMLTAHLLNRKPPAADE